MEPSAPRGLRLPIDFFLRSLAQDQRERAICIILSGTGSDCTLGVRAIKGEGGMVMVQNPESTEYDGMPRSAIDLLIGVTKFFRDPEAFKILEERAIPSCFAGKSVDTVIRVWAQGCSTGEEAYSIAILLAERQESMKQSFKVQVFATDIDSQAIATARAGISQRAAHSSGPVSPAHDSDRCGASEGRWKGGVPCKIAVA